VERVSPGAGSPICGASLIRRGMTLPPLANWRAVPSFVGGGLPWRHSPGCAHNTVRADAAWYSTEGTVEGWCGSRRVKPRLRRARDGTWTSNGALCAAVTGCVDLDLSFTRLRICCR